MTTVKLDDCELDKRFYLPGVVVTHTCTCGAKLSRDMGNDYVSYPTTNKEEEVSLYCDVCDTEIYKKIVIRIEVDILD